MAGRIHLLLVLLTTYTGLLSVHGGTLPGRGSTADQEGGGGSPGGGTPSLWREVSVGRDVTVRPFTASCGSPRRETIPLDRSHTLQDNLYKLLLSTNDSTVWKPLMIGDPNHYDPSKGSDPPSLTCTNRPCPAAPTSSQFRLPTHKTLEVPLDCHPGGLSSQEDGVYHMAQGNPCHLDLKQAGCPLKYILKIWVNPRYAGVRAESPRVLLETRYFHVLLTRKPGISLTTAEGVVVKVDITTGRYRVYTRLNATVDVTMVTQNSTVEPCMVILGGQDHLNSMSMGILNITFFKQGEYASPTRPRRSLLFRDCFCPQSHPFSINNDPYLCHTSRAPSRASRGVLGASRGVLRASVGLSYGQVLVRPEVLTREYLQRPYYWISTPGVGNFILYVHLKERIQVGRVRVSLLTPPPSDHLVIDTETHGGRTPWTPWVRYSYKCSDTTTEGACSTPPSLPTKAANGVPSMWVLDSETMQNVHTPTTRTVRFTFQGYPSQPVGSPHQTLNYHVVAALQVFSRTHGKPTHSNTHKNNLMKTHGYTNSYHNEAQDLRQLRKSLKESPLDTPEDKFQSKVRGKRQAVNVDPQGPVITRVLPPRGPAAGEWLVVQGENLGPPNVTIMVGPKPCVCTGDIANLPRFENVTGCNVDSIAVCEVVNGSDVVGQELAVTLTRADQTAATVNGTNVTFSFRPNPQVTCVTPRTSIESGGRLITMTGTDLNAGILPYLLLTTIYNGDANTFKAQRSQDPCDIVNSTTITCYTPRPDIPNRFRKKRQTDPQSATPSGECGLDIDPRFYLNDPLLQIVLGLETGLYSQNLSDSLGDVRILYIARDPSYEEFQSGQEVLKLWEDDNPKLLIKGQRLTLAAEIDDYMVKVGGVPCNITRLSANSIECIPPKEKDIPADGSRNNNGYPRVSVRVGFQGSFTPGVVVYQNTKPIDWVPILAGVLGALGAILLFVTVFWCWRRNEKYKYLKQRQAILDENYASLVTDESTMLDLLQEDLRKKVNMCKLEPSTVKRSREIGSGNFGKVYIGRLSTKSNPKDKNHTEEYDVAIKTIKDNGATLRQLEDFLEEATIMMDFDHKNVLRLLGVVIENNLPFVVLPFMSNGDLKGYVSNAERSFKVFDLLELLIQVADGMNYVSKRGTVHRDLRAVNCMVDADIVVKVGDFGLARMMDEDYYRVQNQERPLPVKWMAPEALAGSKFSSYSDVWSYGVLMWEVMTRGLKPFADVNNYNLKNHVLRGGRLEKPPFCPPEVYAIMSKCWAARARQRPLFTDISKMLADFMKIGTPEAREMMAGKDDEDYIEVMRERTATNEANEYTKRPGPIPEYLPIIDDTEVVVPSNPGQTSVSEHGNPAFDAKNHKYENDAYLHPLSHGEVHPVIVTDDDEGMTSPKEAAPAAPPSKKEDNPYFVNPPISDEYISPSGHDKLAHSGNIPRGEIYRGKTTKPPPLPQAQVADKVNRDSEEEPGVTEQLIMSPSEEPEDDYVNVKEPDLEAETVNHDVDMVDGQERQSGGVKNLAAKFGGSAKTADYANQPGHMKRTVKK